jgi:hypothetical protein
VRRTGVSRSKQDGDGQNHGLRNYSSVIKHRSGVGVKLSVHKMLWITCLLEPIIPLYVVVAVT